VASASWKGWQSQQRDKNWWKDKNVGEPKSKLKLQWDEDGKMDFLGSLCLDEEK
jgi:hypothetical protein